MAIVPPERPLGRLAFLAAFARNPLEAMPRAVYEEDFVPLGGAQPRSVWITSPALIKQVLLDERDKFRKLRQIRLLSPLLGKGLLTSEGADWKWQRQAASPMFRPAEIAAFVPRFAEAARATVARWRAAGSESIQPVDADMTRATFDVVSSTLLPSRDERFAETMQRSVDAMQRFAGWEILYAEFRLPRWLPRPGGAARDRAVTVLRELVATVLRESPADADDLLRRLVSARDPETGRAMDERQLVDNLLTFYLAGHETTAKALTWTLYLLARHPGRAKRLEEEIDRVVGGGEVTAEALEALTLTQQVIQESMRLYPPVPMMSRQCVAPATLDGHAIAPGMSVVIPIWAIHRHRARWERPEDFDPERFAPARADAMPRYQFMPFGAGPRVCIGRSFAMMEATAILATLLRSVRFGLVDDAEPHPVAGVTLVPRGGLRLKVKTGDGPGTDPGPSRVRITT